MRDYDLLYCLGTPVILALAFLVAARSLSVGKRTATLIAGVLLVLLAGLLVRSGAATNALSTPVETAVWTVAFFLIPAALILATSRIHWVRQHPWVLLLVAPVEFFIGFVVAVNIWLSVGFPI